MPSEIRRLVFFHSELYEAMALLGEQVGAKFPRGQIVKVSIANASETALHGDQAVPKVLSEEYKVTDLDCSVIVTYFDQDSFENKQYNLLSAFVSTALIQYCLKKNIPIPKEGRKKLDITEFNVCLDIIFDDNLEPLSLQLED